MRWSAVTGTLTRSSICSTTARTRSSWCSRMPRASTSRSSTSFAWSLASAFTACRRPHRAGGDARTGGRRELREETGLRLTAITHVLPPAACTVGIGDERTVCVFGTAEGTFRPSTDPMEEIESAWYTRAQVRALHETGPVRFLGAGLQLDVRKRLPAGHLKATHSRLRSDYHVLFGNLSAGRCRF